jgi:hypothetical protein
MVKPTIKKETILKCFVFCLSDLSLPEAAKQFLVAWLTSKPRRRPTWRRCCSTSAERCCEQNLRITQRIRPKMTFLVCLFVCLFVKFTHYTLVDFCHSSLMICKLFPICFFFTNHLSLPSFFTMLIFSKIQI